MPRKPAAPPLVSASGSPPGCQVSLTFFASPRREASLSDFSRAFGPGFFLPPGLFLRSGLQIRKPGRGCLAGPARAFRFNPSVFADGRSLLSLSVVMHRASRREARFVPGRQLLRLLLWLSGAIFGRPDKDRRFLLRHIGPARHLPQRKREGRKRPTGLRNGSARGLPSPRDCSTPRMLQRCGRSPCPEGRSGAGPGSGACLGAPACRVRCQAWQDDRRSAVASLRGRHRPFRPSDRRRTSPAPPSACRDRLVVRSDDVRQYDAARRSAQVRSAFAA